MSNVDKRHQSSINFDINSGRERSASRNKVGVGAQDGSYILRTLLTSAPLVATDLLAFACAVVLASKGIPWLAGITVDVNPLTLTPFLGFGLFLIFLWSGLYPAVMMNPMAEFRSLVVATTIIFVSYVTMSFGVHQGYQVGILFVAWLLSLVLLPAGRSMCRSLCSHFSWWGHVGLIVGRGADAYKVFSFIDSSRRLGLRPVSIIDDPCSLQFKREFANEYQGHWLVFAGDPDLVLGGDRRGRDFSKSDFPLQFRNTIVIAPQHVDDRAGDLVKPLERVDLPSVQEINPLLSPLHCRTKRLFDILVSSLICVAVFPLLVFIAGMLKVTSPGPILYRQTRIGLGGRHFNIYKFRTMEVDADAKLDDYLSANPHQKQEWELNQKIEHDPRITKIGGFLRKTSLDELPQLWNVLMGEMSFVGPRPIVDDEVQRYGDGFDLYTRVPPGITGLWQVYGRNKTTYARRVQLDEFYVQNWSLMFDLYILFRTFRTVMFREGAC